MQLALRTTYLLKPFQVHIFQLVPSNTSSQRLLTTSILLCPYEGVRERGRLCDSPFPTHGGSLCLGNDQESLQCKEDECVKG